MHCLTPFWQILKDAKFYNNSISAACPGIGKDEFPKFYENEPMKRCKKKKCIKIFQDIYLNCTTIQGNIDICKLNSYFHFSSCPNKDPWLWPSQSNLCPILTPPPLTAAGFLSKLNSEQDLEVLESVSEVTGYVAIVSDDDFFTSLKFLR